MDKKAKAAAAAYAREWRRKNPDKVKKNNEAYWARKAAAAEKENATAAGDQEDGDS